MNGQNSSNEFLKRTAITASLNWTGRVCQRQMLLCAFQRNWYRQSRLRRTFGDDFIKWMKHFPSKYLRGDGEQNWLNGKKSHVECESSVKLSESMKAANDRPKCRLCAPLRRPDNKTENPRRNFGSNFHWMVARRRWTRRVRRRGQCTNETFDEWNRVTWLQTDPETFTATRVNATKFQRICMKFA